MRGLACHREQEGLRILLVIATAVPGIARETTEESLVGAAYEGDCATFPVADSVEAGGRETLLTGVEEQTGAADV